MAVLKYIISFRLNRGLKIENPNTPYYLYFRYRQGRSLDFSASTGCKIPLSDWNKEKQKLKNKAHIKNRNEISNFLTGIVDYFEKEIIQFANVNKQPNRNDIKNLFNEYINPTPDVIAQTLFSFIDNYIENARTKINVHTKDKKAVSSGTIKGYVLTKNILIRFDKERYKLNFDNMGLDFYNDFKTFCEKQNLSYNYIGKHIKTIKLFLSDALDVGLTSNLDFKKKEFATLTENTEAIYLTEIELKRMFDLKLKHLPTLDIIVISF